MAKTSKKTLNRDNRLEQKQEIKSEYSVVNIDYFEKAGNKSTWFVLGLIGFVALIIFKDYCYLIKYISLKI